MLFSHSQTSHSQTIHLPCIYFSEHLLCDRHTSRHWGYVSETREVPLPSWTYLPQLVEEFFQDFSTSALWTFFLDNSLSWAPILCNVGFWTVSLTSTHTTPSTLLQLWQLRMSPDIANGLLGGAKSPPVEKHWVTY